MDITLLSYNIHKGFDFLNRKFVLEGIRSFIRDTGADVVCLQEILGAHRKHGKHLPPHFAESQFEYLAESIWRHHSYGRNAVYEEGHHGNCVLSKFPIVKSTNINLTLHEREQRGMLAVEIELPQSKKLFLQTTHLNLLHLHRVQQLGVMKTYYQDLPVDAITLLAGDFNDWNSSLEIEKILELRGAGRAKTFPSFYPLLPLDGVYYKNLELLEFKVLKEPTLAQFSDHLPILARLKI